MAKPKWIHVEAEYCDDGLMVMITEEGLIRIRLARKRTVYEVPVVTLYEALQARAALGLSGTTVPVFGFRGTSVYHEVGTRRPVYGFRLGDVQPGKRPLEGDGGCKWWIRAAGDDWHTLGEGVAVSESAADAAIEQRLTWLRVNCRFVEPGSGPEPGPDGPADLDTSKT